MFTAIKSYLEKALSDYTAGEKREILLRAKDEYFSLTGIIHEENDEYEHKMNCFNDWFLFSFSLEKNGPSIIQDYLLNKVVAAEEEQKEFPTANYSLFEFKKTNSKKQVVLKDILHDTDVIISEMKVAIVEKDFFVGRTLIYKDKGYLMRGICVLPPEVKAICSKQCKRIRKKHDLNEERAFLLSLEFLKTKWLCYGRHVEAKKIFIF